MLKKIRLENYRSCALVEFEPTSSLSVLVGPNGSGKTNIINGIRLLGELCDDWSLVKSRNRMSPTGQSRIKAWFEIEGKSLILTADVEVYTDESNEDVVVEYQQSWYARDFTGSAKRLKISLSEIFWLTVTKAGGHARPRRFSAQGYS
ncbi:MAG: AAA family ATPase, partial [Pseudomonadales bacterium]|nr:AAA family ATPase [Pseudomonadales bacterium]